MVARFGLSSITQANPNPNPNPNPNHAQDTLASIGQPLNWIANLTVSTAFPLVFGALGRNTYLIFVALTAFFGWFTLTRVPETKGKTYEQVAKEFARY